MRKRVFQIFLVFIFGIFGGIFGSQILWPYFVERPLFLKYKLEPSPIYITEKKVLYVQENEALKESIEKVEKSVVFIRTKTKTGKIVEGSGLILTSDGLIITLSDLLPEGAVFSVFVEEEFLVPEILKKDPKENLALIKVDKQNLKTVGFFNLEKLKIGERVFLVAKIFDEGKIKTIMNEGVIKNFNENKIETNIIENQKITGSPLFDIEGKLIGLCKVDKDGKVFVIPNSKIKTFKNL